MAKKAAKRHQRRSRAKKRKIAAAASRTVAVAPSLLSQIALVGPTLLDEKGKATDRYLWSVVINAPYARRGDPIGQNFPVRPLAVDQSTIRVTYKQLRPFPLPPISKSVDFEPPPALHAAVRADDKAYFKLTVASPQSKTSDYFSTDGGREVVAAPIGRYDKTSSDWPLQPLDEISLPVLGLVDGRVSVIIAANNALFKLFSALGVKQNVSGGATSIIVDLTPLGFEFDGSVTLPFAKPGQADPVAVTGRFSLTQERIGIWDQNAPTFVTQICLRKVADPVATQAWTQIAVRFVSAGAAQWSSIERRAGAHAPTLRWAVDVDAHGNFEIDNTLLDLSPDAFTFIFSSTAGPNLRTHRPDGVAVLAPECLQMKFWSNQIDIRAFCLSRPDPTRQAVAPAPPRVEYKYDGQTQTETIAIVSPTLSYQPRDLAQRLRNFYGMMPFDPATATPPLTPPPSAPPWLWAFTPVERGWVQFPVPNVPPPDPNDDAERIASLPPDVGGGAFTGFARFSNRQQGAEPIPPLGGGGDPPWSVSLDRADAFRGTWTLDASAAYAPSKTDIVFEAPQMFCRGLIWISADAPGPQEALPRLSAGPGSLVDIAFDIGAPSTTEAGRLVFSLDDALILKIAGQNSPPTLSYNGISAGLVDGTGARPVLRRGSTGPAVRDLQRLLQIKVDGSFGPQTETAVKDFQRANHLKVDGIVGPKTWAALADLPPVSVDLAKVLGSASEEPPTWKDLRAVAWMRHPNIPLIAEMPMTRASGSDTGPLESRDFAPYRCEPFDPHSRLFQVRHADGAFWNTLVETSGRDGRLSRLVGWPWSGVQAATAKGARAPRAAADPLEQIVGIAFAPVGVAGVETQPAEQLGPSWKNASFAYRYDIAVLDEAFATAEPPPVAAAEPPPADQPPTPPAPPKPVTTALDLVALKKFWDDQRDRHSLSRVQASYAFGWGGRAQRNVDVANLVQPYVWQTTASFSDAADLGAVTVGPLVNGPLVNASGTKALLGLSARFKINAQYLTIADDGTIPVIGWSPTTYDANGLTVDMRGFAAESAPRAVGGLLIRTVQVLGVDLSPSRLVSARKSYTVALSAQECLAFWFRDLPVTRTDGRNASWVYQPVYAPGIDFDDATRNWLREQLPFAGFEWRLGYRSEQGLWHDALEFFGLYLTPLRLAQVSFSDDEGEP
jgi:hypothetical protein